MKPTILAIETASERCSIALHHQGEVFVRESEQPRGHASLILPMINEILSETKLSLSTLDALAYSKGPGAFTSIRIGTSVVQGLALGSNLPVASASSLEIMAQKLAAEEGAVILAALDARMNEVYFGVYQIENGFAVPLQEDQVAKPNDILLGQLLQFSNAYAIGSGWHVYADAMQARFQDYDVTLATEYYPHALELLDIALRHMADDKLHTAEQILPVYIRDNVTHGS